MVGWVSDWEEIHRAPRGCGGSMVGPEKEQVSHSAGLDVSGFQSGAGPADPGQMQRALGQEFPDQGAWGPA